MIFTFFFSLQRNGAGSSQGMEYLAFQKGMEYFITHKNVAMKSFVTDRHYSIAKHMKEHMASVKHYFDLWHLRKSKLQQLSLLIIYFRFVTESAKIAIQGL